MHDIELDPRPPTPTPPKRRHRWWIWALATFGVLAAICAVLVWQAFRPPAPVSVPDVVSKFRSNQPSVATGSDGPARGVYVYATTGWEHVSSGNITHHYPKRTTLSVTDGTCGLRIRWDALAGRWMQWDLCRTSSGWRLQHLIDAHKFLYFQDIHEYTCSGYPVIVCRTGTGVLTSTVQSVAPDHVRITQEATGKSISSGVIEAWLLPNGLPRRVVVNNHGSQKTLGQQVKYTESATYVLTSTAPRR